MLQPLDGDSQTDRGKHKFMVQSMYAPETVDDVDKLVMLRFCYLLLLDMLTNNTCNSE